MASGASYVRHILNGIITRMSNNPSQFANNPDTDFKRNRKISFTNLVNMLLSFGGNSLNKELYDYYKQIDIETPTASALVQQRNKLKPEAMEFLFNEFNKTFKNPVTYKGYRLLAVDSSTLTYDGYNTDDTYRPNSCGWNQFQLHAMFDVLNKIYVDVHIEPRTGNNEPKAAREMAKRTLIDEKRIIICDRGYGGFNLIEHINRTPNADYLIRIKDNLWNELSDIPMTNIDTQLTFTLTTSKNKENKEDREKGKLKFVHTKRTRRGRTTSNWDFESEFTLTVRIVRIQTGENTYETIATSLPKSIFPFSAIKELYKMRWGIETSFRELKYAIALTSFHSKKREFILQEIYARLAMYNFCQRIIMSVVIAQDKKKKWMYQANFTMGIYICRNYFRCRSPDEQDVEREIRNYILPIRPDRTDTRKVIPKAAVFFLYRVA